MSYLYLWINIVSFSVPFIYSFEKKMRFIQYWKAVFLAVTIVAIPFLIWDVIFTEYGIWGFNPYYYLGITFFGLPIEEILFFICIPFASIFTHYVFIHFFKNLKLSDTATQIITIFLLIGSVVILIFAFPKAYTSVNFSLFTLLMLYALIKKDTILNRFYITFLWILIPFFIVNGLLTGSFISGEVVWYNNAQNLGFRIGTVPIEDAFYAFNMLYMSIILIEKFKVKFNKKLHQ